MTDYHLINSIKLLERTVLAHEIKSAFAFSNMVQGDMASLDADQAVEEVLSEDHVCHMPPIYEKMQLEAQRRELDVEPKE